MDGYNVRRSAGFEPDALGVGGIAAPPQPKPQDKPRKQGMVGVLARSLHGINHTHAVAYHNA